MEGTKLAIKAKTGPISRPAQPKRPRTPRIAMKILTLAAICFRLIVSRKMARANRIGTRMKIAVKTTLKSRVAVVKARIV